jgi:hypothetical protein
MLQLHPDDTASGFSLSPYPGDGKQTGEHSGAGPIPGDLKDEGIVALSTANTSTSKRALDMVEFMASAGFIEIEGT